MLFMNTNDSTSGRWVGIAVSAAFLLGACGSTPTEDATADTSPPALMLEEAPTTTVAESPIIEAPAAADVDVAEFSGLEDLSGAELTPELFEELKTDESSRAAIIDEMVANGLSPDDAACFLDSVSPGLLMTFGVGDDPDDDQIVELFSLLETCEIAFGPES